MTRRALLPGRWLLLAPSILTLATVLPSRVEAAGGAFVVDDAEIAALNTCQVESWVSFARNHDFVGVSNPACTVNVIRPVELGVLLLRSRAAGVWGSLLSPQAKTVFAPVETGKIGFGLAAGMMFDLANDQDTSSYAYVPATWKIDERFSINANVGWRHDRVADLHWLTWGSSFEWTFVKPVTLIAEVFGEAGHRPIFQRSLADPRAQAGLRFTPVDNVDVDIIYGRNVTGVRTHWFTIGLNVRAGS